MSDDLELTGRRALVTGGTLGIGQAVVLDELEYVAVRIATSRRPLEAKFATVDSDGVR